MAVATKAKTKTTMDRKPAAKKKTKAVIAAELYDFKMGIAKALGVAIPILSVTLSHIAGSLTNEVPYLAAFIALIGVAVLCVSLSHLSEAIEDTTGSNWFQGWALAITLDLSIVGCELTHVYSSNAPLWWWTTALMVVVMVFSMVLNVYAFTKHVK